MISVVIPSFNSFKTISYTLQSLASSPDTGLLSEIIIVDSSDDGKTKPFLCGYRSDKIRVIDGGVKLMPAAARNLGAKYATGDILAFIDADAFAATDWLENIAAASRRGIRIGGGPISLPEFQRNKVIPLAQYFLQFNEFMEGKHVQDKKFVPSVNMFCERKFFDEIGGFPLIRASEDVLFGLKANRLSTVRFLPAIRVFHVFREDIRSFLENQLLLGKYIIIYRRIQDAGVFYYRGLWPLLLLPFFLAIKLFRITRHIFKGRSAYILRYFLVLPVFLLGLLFWALGFVAGIFSSEKTVP